MKNFWQEYLKKINNGEIITSEKVKWIYKIVDEKVKIGKWKYDSKKGNRIIDFVEKFCFHYQGKWAGQNLILELWQKAFLDVVFGIVNPKTNLRIFTKAMLIMGRKNGKSAFVSAIQVYMLLADGEPGSEVYSVATKRDQARIVFNGAKATLEQSKFLRPLVHITKHDIEHKKSRSILKPLSSDAHKMDGLNPHFTVMDEVGAIKDIALLSVMESAMGAREQPLVILITTSGFVREGLYDDQYTIIEAMLKGNVDLENFFPVVYEVDSEKEWKFEENWIKANPNLGVSKSIWYLRNEYEKAKVSPTSEAEFKTKHCNLKGIHADAVFEFEILEDIHKNKIADLENFRNSSCVVGFDLSRSGDLTGMTFLTKKDDEFYSYTLGIMPKEKIDKRKVEDKVPYDVWIKKGLIFAIEGHHVDFEQVVDLMLVVKEKYNLKILATGGDPWSSAELEKWLKRKGYKFKSVPQYFTRLSSPFKELIGIVQDKKIYWNYKDEKNPENDITNNAFLWNISNITSVRDPSDNIRPAKKSSIVKIDLFMSFLNAFVIFKQNENSINESARLDLAIKKRYEKENMKKLS